MARQRITKKPLVKSPSRCQPYGVITGRVTKSRSHSSDVRLSKVDMDVNQSTLVTITQTASGEPPAWADYRTELSDTLPWFRAVQGGSYHHGSLCWGFLLDADCGTRSYVDEEIVITRIGGGCTKDKMGNLVLNKDQDNENIILKSIIRSRELKVPIGIIIGDRNTLLGRKLPHRYNVMGYFRITDIWFERLGQRIGAKVRFEKLDLSTKSWWAAKGSPPPIPHRERDFECFPDEKTCHACAKKSPRIYNEGWTCLIPTCKLFWTIDGSPPPAHLSFHKSFLIYRTPFDPGVQPHHSLVPDLLSTIDEGDQNFSSLRIAWRGIVCPKCHKCISRRYWRGWKCSDCVEGREEYTGACSYEKFFKISPISLRYVIEELELSPIKRILNFDPKFAFPEIDDASLYPYRKMTYNIPGVGYVIHFVSNRAINSRANGPDDLFHQMQATDLGLRRYPLQQSGMPYKYVVSVDSRRFDEAPDGVLRALGRLTWATEKAVEGSGDAFLSPNELLILGYLEDMKIGYHDDGESSLGPTIATLSLGAKSTMLIRMKYKYYNGVSRAGKLLDIDPVLPSCRMQHERQLLTEQFQRGEIARADYDILRWSTIKKTRHTEASPIIKMELNHGDLVVMHGEELQKYYEHSVIPEKKLRFALTARYIRPDHVNKSQLEKGNFTLSPDEMYDGK
ncbi:2OG-Fe(II) oxygenase superfamily-domain-containing protein [Aspergillus ambiguus]|uniref:uncharacterized protein n=1 Tax=Aspergillus ambiguus TaxID=176160 RepID=UPI003CCD7021